MSAIIMPPPVFALDGGFSRRLERVLNASIDVINWPEVLQSILSWASRHGSRYVCIRNVHSVVIATQDAPFGRVTKEADLATPDAAPIAWMLRRLGFLH
jgi:N-acetylglucosaminyldiphosphoundecaprenol N-acetyl-beta-D-mannosaminyltransferase